MIIINDYIISEIEDINFFVDNLRKSAYKEDLLGVADIYEQFLLECYDADKKLQEMVYNRFGDNYVSFVIIPTKEIENLSSFSFQLANTNDEVVKRRFEVFYRDFCTTCFKDIVPFHDRLIKYYEDYFHDEP